MINVDRRETLGTWFKDVGYLYLLVVVTIAIVFFLKDLPQYISAIETVEPRPSIELPYDAGE